MTRLMDWVASCWWPISLSLLSLVTVLSLIPLPELPRAGGDKLHHFLAYASIMFPVALRAKNNWWTFALLCIVWSGLIEVVQPYVNRQGEWLDLLANSTGVLIGVMLGSIANKLFIRKDESKI